jgi:hypothetical protein
MYEIENNKIRNTGSKLNDEYITEEYRFENYSVIIKFDKERNFLGIEQISVKKPFYTYKDIIKQKIQYQIREPTEDELKEIEK